MNDDRRWAMKLGGLAAAALLAPLASPTRASTVARLWVGFPAGATGDRIARAVSPVLASALDATVVVENKAGAGGQIAIELVKQAPADGTMLLQTIGSSMVIYPHTYKSLRYKPFEDFTPIGTVATVPIVLVASRSTPATTFAEAAELIRRDKKYAFFGSPASGSVFHFSGVLLQRDLGSNFDHVPYKGSAPLLQDVLSGQVPFGFMAQSDVLEHQRAGSLRILAVTGTTRSSQLPEVRTFPELGHASLVNREWFSYFLSAKTPAPIVAKYRAALRQVVASEEVRKKLLDGGLEVSDGDHASLADTMAREYGQWRQVVKDIGFVADS